MYTHTAYCAVPQDEIPFIMRLRENISDKRGSECGSQRRYAAGEGATRSLRRARARTVNERGAEGGKDRGSAVRARRVGKDGGCLGDGVAFAPAAARLRGRLPAARSAWNVRSRPHQVRFKVSFLSGKASSLSHLLQISRLLPRPQIEKFCGFMTRAFAFSASART